MESNILCWADIPVANLPSVGIIESLVNKLRSVKDIQTAVQWDTLTNSMINLNINTFPLLITLFYVGIPFTILDLNLMKNLVGCIKDIKQSVKKEKEMVNTFEISPPGNQKLVQLIFLIQ